MLLNLLGNQISIFYASYLKHVDAVCWNSSLSWLGWVGLDWINLRDIFTHTHIYMIGRLTSVMYRLRFNC